jgi:hypothetical protein
MDGVTVGPKREDSGDAAPRFYAIRSPSVLPSFAIEIGTNNCSNDRLRHANTERLSPLVQHGLLLREGEAVGGLAPEGPALRLVGVLFNLLGGPPTIARPIGTMADVLRQRVHHAVDYFFRFLAR